MILHGRERARNGRYVPIGAYPHEAAADVVTRQRVLAADDADPSLLVGGGDAEGEQREVAAAKMVEQP